MWIPAFTLARRSEARMVKDHTWRHQPQQHSRFSILSLNLNGSRYLENTVTKEVTMDWEYRSDAERRIEKRPLGRPRSR
jgi:hypothetical protein